MIAGIEYEQVRQMGVLVFAFLDINAGNIGFVGTRAVALIVAGDATIDAVVDAARGWRWQQATPGPRVAREVAQPRRQGAARQAHGRSDD